MSAQFPYWNTDNNYISLKNTSWADHVWQEIQHFPVSLLCRLDFKTILHRLREGSAVFPDSDPSSDDSTNAPAVPLDRTSLWRALLYKNPPPLSKESTNADKPTANSVGRGTESNQRSSRGRRNAYVRGHHHQHGQLMRVGCILGTCQAQKLSHRLYQLVGQTGREDSAPINPNNPHSYGWSPERLQPKPKPQQNSSTCIRSLFLPIVLDCQIFSFSFPLVLWAFMMHTLKVPFLRRKDLVLLIYMTSCWYTWLKHFFSGPLYTKKTKVFPCLWPQIGCLEFLMSWDILTL